ncbi:gliding motility-associated C-terminal domain-containing protein [uncultured Draconibacterium sp.]|uniref:T9SS type B sorting domain-containing protein n=1 Tax=uncultured Draconibacterium sp. TaxID=1573823 RepID=UPI0032166053
MKRSLYFFVTLMLFSFALQAQISSPNADGTDVTDYPVFAETDSIYIFCTNDTLAESGSLLVRTELAGTKTFLWEKYNEVSGVFESYSQESSDGATSQIENLADGCYRSTITVGGDTEINRAWVFNNWTTASAYVSDSNCESFRLNGEFKTAVLNYYDLSDNTKLEVLKDVNVEWQQAGYKISSLLNLEIVDPPYENTDYVLLVSDKFNCGANYTVTYESIVTKAEFTVNPESGEGPLTVNFTNTSQNGSPGYYEWFFYRDIDEITRESEGASEPVDSINFVAYDDSPVYTYENSGAYWVKLVSKHVSEFFTCVDTFALEEYIIVDTSFVAVPNVFTPNGDGVNDQFIVKFWSMKSIEINIYNRYGRRVHYWKSGDVQGFEGTWSETVWDGKIGGGYASPGVYYWDVVGKGRDGVDRTEHGFVHLFRDKN